MTRNIHQIPVRQHNENRIRRAESWLRRSKVADVNRQQAVSDEDKAAFDCEQFIFLWISFNNTTVWLSRNQLPHLFKRDVKTIGKHINNVFKEGELEKDSVVANFATTAIDGKTYQA